MHQHLTDLCFGSKAVKKILAGVGVSSVKCALYNCLENMQSALI